MMLRSPFDPLLPGDPDRHAGERTSLSNGELRERWFARCHLRCHSVERHRVISRWRCSYLYLPKKKDWGGACSRQNDITDISFVVVNRMSGFVPNGLLSSEANSVTKVLDQKRWSKAEARAAELLASIKPNNKSETRRNAVVSYIQRLLMNSIPCQVFTFGSVPLKTYLPDGDIDLTAFGDHQKLHESFIPKILCILESQLKNEHAEFKVKEVQYIQAEVKIIKCLVENFVVDISFNMLGGLCSLCFLEEINCLIGQNHLFKRSIILIKAWCYYESRILGSNHGLISTYALEILVLYIFHLYNNRFAGPFEVLLRFLDFFSKFDWDNYCISLRGPVPIGSLPKMIAEPPRKDCRDLPLTEWFLNVYQSCYNNMPRSQENQDQLFVSKHINIIDPLCANNNLGRSISKGNFFRIKSAIAFGAQRLVKLLDCSEENLIPEFDFFFKNTWTRRGNGCWIHARVYNLYLRNKNVEKSTCQESEVEQAQASHGSQSQDIYQKPGNHLKESKQTFGTSDGSAVSQTGSLRTNGMFTCDREHTSSMKSALADKGKKSPEYSSNVVPLSIPVLGSFLGPLSVSLYSTEQHKHPDTSLVYSISEDETSEHFVNQSSDTLNGDYGSYWLNLQYARFCQNAKSEKPSFYPPTIAPPMYLQAQHPWNWSPPSSVSVVAPSAPLFPEMPSTLVPRPHEGINQSITFWLPRFIGGTGTFIPYPQGYNQRFYERKRPHKNQNRNDFNSRERLSSHGQFQRQVEKPGDLKSNSRERFSSSAQLNRRAAKPGTKEAPHQGKGSKSVVNKLNKFGKRF